MAKVELREKLKEHRKNLITSVFVFPIVGLILLFQERITEIIIPNVGTIKTATEQAILDVQQIKSIKERTENQSATIDLIAKRANDTERELNKKINLADEKIEALTSDQKKVSDILESVKDDQEFLSLVYRAENYNIDTFRELTEISNNREKYSLHAKKIVDNIKRHLEEIRVERFGTSKIVLADGRNNSYKGPFSTEEVLQALLSGRIEAAANVVRMRKIKSVAPYLIMFIRIEKDLRILNKLTYAVSELVGKEFYPWNINELIEWWNIHQSNYPVFPYNNFYNGMNSFAERDCKKALENFNAIIEFDTGVDMSRVLAIICAVELQDLSLADNLYNSFKKFSAGRWGLLANTKIRNCSTPLSESLDLYTLRA